MKDSEFTKIEVISTNDLVAMLKQRRAEAQHGPGTRDEAVRRCGRRSVFFIVQQQRF